VEQLVEGQVLLAINVALRQFGDIGTWTNTHNFDQAEARIALLTQLIQELPGAILDINPDELCQQLARCRGQYEEHKRSNEAIQRLRGKKEAIALRIKNKERKGECSIL
jgi:Tfp pilus assembly protein PilN